MAGSTPSSPYFRPSKRTATAQDLGQVPTSQRPGGPAHRNTRELNQTSSPQSPVPSRSQLSAPLSASRFQPSSSQTPCSGTSQGIREHAASWSHNDRALGTQSVISSSRPSGHRRSASILSGRKSRATSSIWGSDSYQVICAVSEARGVSPSVGLAFVNITTNEAILSQICDSQFYVKTLHKLEMYDPDTILMVNTAFSPSAKSNLLSIVEEEFRGTSIKSMDRKYWSESTGLDLIHTLAFREDIESIKVALQGNFYAVCAFSAVIRYMELSCQLTVMSHSLRIRYQPSENSMMIDISTIQSLELIQNIQEAKSRHCLFGLLNDTLTPMGARMLRSNVLQPSTQVDQTLSPRFDALDEFTIKEDMFFETRTALRGITDAEKLLTKLVIVPQNASIYESELAINHVLMIKSFVSRISPLYEALSSARSQLLQKIRGVCRPELIRPLQELMANTINDDVSYVKTPIDLRHQRTYAVKTGVHGMLDVARQTYKEGVDDAHEHAEKLNTEFNVAFEIRYDENRKYFLRIKECELEGRDAPNILINRVKRSGYVECQTLGLVQLNNRITDSHNETVMLSDKVINQLLDAIRGHIPNLFRVCEGIALLDMLAAFGQCATSRDYIRPEFGDTVAFKGARHPICEMMMQDRFVPNDVYASVDHRFQIITGCNMSGKSTYIRMVALLQVMAQVGCFVPAEYAHFMVIDQIFVRMSTDDSIEANLSTFSIEMREMAFILNNIGGKSLAVIDELGRGTSTRDGLAIALAISEALIQSNSLVWFATHFHQLANVLGSRPGVLNLHLGAKLSNAEDGSVPKLTMLYKINSGVTEDEHYGIWLAKVVGFNDRFLQVAENTSRALEQMIEQKKHNSQHRKLARRRKLIMSLHGMLKQMEGSDMDDAALGTYLCRLQAEFAERMHALENDGAASASVDEEESSSVLSGI